MRNEGFIILVLILGVVAAVLAGPVLALLALVRGNRNTHKLERLERETADLLRREAEQKKASDLLSESVRQIQEHMAAPGAKPFVVPQPSPSGKPAEAAEGAPPTEKPVAPLPQRPAVPPSVPPPLPPTLHAGAAQELQGVLGRIQAAGGAPAPLKPATTKPPVSFEFQLGTKWINWVGAVILLIGVALGLKYAYDNSWIGPEGRLAIGTSWGVIALILGERFRRKDWGVLFQTLTGLGLGIFYACVYFSFQVYKLSDPTTSFVLAVCVTALAIALAVVHNAMPIAIIAVLGGFLSPVLISTGENRPVALFSYVALLNLVALGAAYYRRWRPLELLCFAGTALLYGAWFEKYYLSAPAGQMTVALGFISLFYLMFLLIPTIHTMARGLPESHEGVVLVVLNAAFALAVYYRILYPEHAKMLGFVAIGQALLVFVLFQSWVRSVGTDTQTGPSLLIISLALVTVAIPLEFKLYGIPIAWALEGALLTYVGLRFESVYTRLIGLAAMVLAAGGLFHRVPMHTQEFMPVLNIPFGSWAVVAAAAFVAAWFAVGGAEKLQPFEKQLAVPHFVIGFILAAFAITAEVSQYWSINHLATPGHATYEASSLIVLWSVIAAGSVALLRRLDMLRGQWLLLPAACYVIAAGMFMVGIGNYRLYSMLPMFNGAFLPRLAFPLALWWGSRQVPDTAEKPFSLVLEVACHVSLAILLAVELIRWGKHSVVVDPRMANALISAVWALQATVLVVLGLATRNRMRRILGFALFALTVAKIFFVDTASLEYVYRIVSFVATGLLLLVVGYFYQRYLTAIFGPQPGDEPPGAGPKKE